MLPQNHVRKSECSATMQSTPDLKTRPVSFNHDSQAVNN
jgi:hypothetical protein